jgi:hypothetical protein
MRYQYNRGLCYRSGKEKGSAAGENKPIISEEIGKDAIKGHLICNVHYITYSTTIRAQVPVYKNFSHKNTSLGEECHAAFLSKYLKVK